jgi:hypothetical protein
MLTARRVTARCRAARCRAAGGAVVGVGVVLFTGRQRETKDQTTEENLRELHKSPMKWNAP